ncbi:MAG: septum formation initiator family protein [Minisyncoccia bacterium]|jgi:cell division protein FtsB
MKIVIALILVAVLVFVASQVVFFMKQERSLSQTLADTMDRLRAVQTQEQALSAEVNYLTNPMNLEKELRARFNYAKPGETMIVIVQSSTATSSGD